MFNEPVEIKWKTSHFCILNFSFQNHFVRELNKYQVFDTVFVKNTPLRVVLQLFLFSVFQLIQKSLLLVNRSCSNSKCKRILAWSSSDYFESLLLPQ